MNNFSYAIDVNIRRFQNLLWTSVDETERQTIQRLLSEEEAKARFLPIRWGQDWLQVLRDQGATLPACPSLRLRPIKKIWKL